MDSNFLIIGTREVWGNVQPFGLTREDRRQHLYAIGQTGTGKSTLLRSLIAQDIANGEGCAVLDPHGDLAESLLDLIPSSRTDDLVLIEPAVLDHPVAINPFYKVPQDERPLVASNLVAAFKHLWSDSWGPRLEYLLFNTLRAVLDAPDHLRPTILSIPRMYVDASYRESVVKHICDPQVRQFWEGDFASWNDRFLSEVVSPVQNKVGAFVSAPSLRNVLGQWKPTINLSQIMEDRKILIVNLSKGQLGEDKGNLIGSLLVAAFQAAAMRRAQMLEERRRDFHLFLDEFQNFGTDAFASILSESRKFRLTLTLSHQYLAQISAEVRSAVFGNVGSIVCFRVGAEDATTLARELTEYQPAVLRGLERGRVCVRLLNNGDAGQPFLGATHPLDFPKAGRAKNMRSQARQRYSRKRETVEENITRWFAGKTET